ncbi:MAG TPA: TonB-dependent receptor [Lacibacter sp.]|nr:TonB-dependent receptor [Lacibacter sp.]
MPNKKSSLPSLHRTMARTALLLAVLFQILFTVPLRAQERTLRGKITGEGGAPVASASISVKGTARGTTSDNSGNFTISVEPGNTLVISAIGFTTREIAVGNQADITISLTTADKSMSEVVVIGYGTARKRDVTGAVVSVGEKELREIPVANLQQALQGRAAGLEIQRTGNQPGSGGQIRIRGIRSISGSNDPLFVVDGIPWEGTLNDINPDDVASIDILKDASATAIYGSRGANGVILVTTKKGRSGETRVSYNGYYGVGQVMNPYPVFNSAEYMSMRNLSTWSQGYMPQEITGMQRGTNTNWQDLMYQNSIRTDHNINVSGGSAGNTFSLGGGYFKETTVLPGEDFTRFTLRAAIDSRIGKKIKIGASSQNILTITNGTQFVSGSPLFRMLAMSPLISPYDSLGNINPTPWGNIDDINANGRYSPLYLKQNNNHWVDRVRRLRTFNSLYAEYEILKGLKYRANLGLNYDQQHGGQFRAADLPGNPSFFRAALGNIARVDNGENWGYTLENLLFYDKTIKEKHRLNFTGLYSIQEQQGFSNFIQKDSIDDNFVRFYNLALSTPVNSSNTQLGGGESRWALISYMARVNYAFNDKYLLTFTYRRDGSSRLAPGNQWFNYPAVSAGWVISDEPFMQKLKAVSSLKLRAGWGQTSNQAINPYQSLGLVNNSNGLAAGDFGGNITRYNFGPTVVTGYNVVTLPNPNLSWEFTSVGNVGLDFNLFNSRITGSLELYNAQTNRILYTVNLPVTSGVAGSYLTNIGEMSNKGVEFTLSTVNYTSKSGFNWSSDFNLFFNRNRLLKLNGNVREVIGSQLFVGHPMSAIFDFQKLGIWQISEAEEAARFGAIPGQLKLKDHSGPEGKPDGIINDLDRHIIGDGDARLQGGMTHRFSYKGFDVSTVFYARFGGTIISQLHQPNAAFITILDGRRNALNVDYWTPTNPSNWFPQPQAQISNMSTAWSTLGYYSGTFVKLRSVNLGYTFQKDMLKRFGVQALRAYFNMDNAAILFSPFFRQTGVDPEGTGVGNQGVSNPGNIRGGANGTVTVGLGTPPRRTYTFGLNLTL